MNTAWFVVVSFMLIVYVVLDGRNFGVGMLHWFVARTQEERRQVIATLKPLFSWHEVWLIAFGGTLVAVFPRLMASAFSGYYLALFLILWCYILRGVALEVGGHLGDRMWRGFWDFFFVISSFLLAVLFGAAGGNMARGVPLDAQGNFSMAFFTNFELGKYPGLLDWYTVSIAVFAVVMLAAHGANYLVLKTDGAVHERSLAWARRLWPLLIPLLLIVSLETWHVRPDLPWRTLGNPVSWLGMILVLAAAGALASALRGGREQAMFAASSLLIAALLATGATTIYPIMLYSTVAPENSLTIYNSASSPNSLLVAAIWWPFALVLTIGYFVYVSRQYLGKVGIRRDNPNH
jgi:cytochrome bd ubiquinol oxidase subunit II